MMGFVVDARGMFGNDDWFGLGLGLDWIGWGLGSDLLIYTPRQIYILHDSTACTKNFLSRKTTHTPRYDCCLRNSLENLSYNNGKISISIHRASSRDQDAGADSWYSPSAYSSSPHPQKPIAYVAVYCIEL